MPPAACELPGQPHSSCRAIWPPQARTAVELASVKVTATRSSDVSAFRFGPVKPPVRSYSTLEIMPPKRVIYLCTAGSALKLLSGCDTPTKLPEQVGVFLTVGSGIGKVPVAALM